MTDHPSPLADGTVVPLIVDDHEPSRVGLAVLLRREPWVARCVLARDPTEARSLARHQRPDVVILDVSNAGPFIESIAATVRETRPGMEIVLTSRCPVQLPASPGRLGARTYVPPGDGGTALVDAVRTALISHEDIPPTGRPDASGQPQLSLRERELLLLISGGATNREIGEALNLGPDAIKKNASALYRKLGVRNRVEAATYSSALFGPPPNRQHRGRK